MRQLLIFLLISVFCPHLYISAKSPLFHSPDSSLPLDHKLFSTNKDRRSAILSDVELNSLKEGDILLRKGYGWVSDRIADLLNEKIRITHCGLILTQGYSEPHVLHTISDDNVNGMFVEALTAYLKQSQQGSLVGIRLKGSVEKTKEVVVESKRLLSKKVPFDLGFNDADSSSFYCAELFAHVFKNVFHRDILPERINLYGVNAIRMRNFLNPKEFEVLFNQFEY
jgi:hypothetical protein